MQEKLRIRKLEMYVFSDKNLDIKYAQCTEEQKKYICGPNFCSVICFFMSASIASAKHADIGLFSLLIGAHEN